MSFSLKVLFELLVFCFRVVLILIFSLILSFFPSVFTQALRQLICKALTCNLTTTKPNKLTVCQSNTNNILKKRKKKDQHNYYSWKIQQQKSNFKKHHYTIDKTQYKLLHAKQITIPSTHTNEMKKSTWGKKRVYSHQQESGPFL